MKAMYMAQKVLFRHCRCLLKYCVSVLNMLADIMQMQSASFFMEFCTQSIAMIKEKRKYQWKWTKKIYLKSHRNRSERMKSNQSVPQGVRETTKNCRLTKCMPKCIFCAVFFRLLEISCVFWFNEETAQCNEMECDATIMK